MDMDPVRAKTPIKQQLAVVSGWLAAIVNTEAVGAQLTPAQAESVIITILGRPERITFKRLVGLDGGSFIAKLIAPPLQIQVPEAMSRVIHAFCNAWKPEDPHCETCALPAFMPNDDLTGVDRLTEGTLCPFCQDGASILVSRPYWCEILHWVTGAWVPDTMDIDTTTVSGASIPVSEQELRKAAVTAPTLLMELDARKVTVGGFLRYLMVDGAKEFGLQPVAVVLLDALQSGSAFTKHGQGYLPARLIEAKRFIAKLLETKRPAQKSAEGVGRQVPAPAPPAAPPAATPVATAALAAPFMQPQSPAPWGTGTIDPDDVPLASDWLSENDLQRVLTALESANLVDRETAHRLCGEVLDKIQHYPYYRDGKDGMMQRLRVLNSARKRQNGRIPFSVMLNTARISAGSGKSAKVFTDMLRKIEQRAAVLTEQ